MNEKFPNRREFLKGLLGVAIAPKVLETINENFKFFSEANAQESQGVKREYKIPAEGRRIRKEEANFSIFPEQLQFKPGKKTLIVSTFWQTGAVYDADGTLLKLDGKPLFFQLGTGKLDTPTRLGLYEIQTKQNANYRSNEFSVVDSLGRKAGAPMPFAMHLGRADYNAKGILESKPQTGVAIHGRHTVDGNSAVGFMSHGCIGVEEAVARFLQSLFSRGGTKNNKYEMGDFVFVVGENVSEKDSLKEAISDVKAQEKGLLEKIKSNSKNFIEKDGVPRKERLIRRNRREEDLFEPFSMPTEEENNRF